MKNIFLFLSCLTILLLFNCNGKPKSDSFKCSSVIPPQGEFKDEFRILKIDSIENVYIIYARRNDSIFKIASKKVLSLNCQTIKIGEDIRLKIVSVFLPEEFHVKMRTAGVKIEGVLIPIEEETIVRDLYLTENLKGLCYLPTYIVP
jgi:hypothetical protein